jgi:AraC-like DNA-binding protein
MASFTDDFINRFGDFKGYPIFNLEGNPCFILSQKEKEEFEQIFVSMQEEITSDYLYKYDRLRNLVFEVIHKAMKSRPNEVKVDRGTNASSRICSLFTELLELQFPIEEPDQMIKLRTAQDFAHKLKLHPNHLNRVLKQLTGKTTSQFIMSRLIQEAKIVLKHTNWNISEVGYCLGFEDTSHFIGSFKKIVGVTPRMYRNG